jgi:hypothetical protein
MQIPLAMKLRECGVFGVSCDEFLDYASGNRSEWEAKGRDIVESMRSEIESKLSLLLTSNDCDGDDCDPESLALLLSAAGGGEALLSEDNSVTEVSFSTSRRFL